jgi:hypothetical protein
MEVYLQVSFLICNTHSIPLYFLTQGNERTLVLLAIIRTGNYYSLFVSKNLLTYSSLPFLSILYIALLSTFKLVILSFVLFILYYKYYNLILDLAKLMLIYLLGFNANLFCITIKHIKLCKLSI